MDLYLKLKLPSADCLHNCDKEMCWNVSYVYMQCGQLYNGTLLAGVLTLQSVFPLFFFFKLYNEWLTVKENLNWTLKKKKNEEATIHNYFHHICWGCLWPEMDTTKPGHTCCLWLSPWLPPSPLSLWGSIPSEEPGGCRLLQQMVTAWHSKNKPWNGGFPWSLPASSKMTGE